jgi:competence protein ComEA
MVVAKQSMPKPASSSPVWQQQTHPQQIITSLPQSGNLLTPLPIVPGTPTPPNTTLGNIPAIPVPKRRRATGFVALTLAGILAVALFLVWHSAPTVSTTTPTTTGTSITQQNFGNSSGGSTSATGSTIQVYVVGAVKHPGVYTLASGARVYDLLQAAGGPLPQANLIALNLVAKLSDGQEVYVTAKGEAPPTYLGGVPGTGAGAGTSTTTQCVNINTASVTDLRTNLHLSSTSAQAIINFRVQQGQYSSVDQLTQVVSKTIYDKIKGMVCIS